MISVKTTIKMLAVSRCITLKQLAKMYEVKTGETLTYPSFLGKLNRESLSLKEATIIAEILNYKLKFIDML